MNNKRTVICSVSFAIIAIALAAGFAFLINPAENAASAPSLAAASSTHMVDVSTSTDYTTVNGSYPQFSDLPTSFNKEIADTAQKAISDHYDASKENWDAEADTSSSTSRYPVGDDKFDLIVKPTVVRNDAQIASVLLDIAGFSGGAHGYDNQFTFNYDRSRNQEITIQSLQAADPNILQEFSAISRAKLPRLLAEEASSSISDIDQTMLDEGTTPTVDNFSTFTFPDANHITVYFGQYQIAAYVFGTTELTISWPLSSATSSRQ